MRYITFKATYNISNGSSGTNLGAVFLRYPSFSELCDLLYRHCPEAIPDTVTIDSIWELSKEDHEAFWKK